MQAVVATNHLVESQPEYQQFLRRQEEIEKEQAEEEQRQAAEREAQWRKVEEEAQEQWRKLQERLAQAKDERLKQNLKIRLEWEREQEKLKEIQLEKERKLEEERAQQEKHVKELLDFLEQGGDTPEHLKRTMETNPGKKPCPFFQKVCACRFFDTCSRNHIRPGVSSTLLITNFFTHISLEVKENEHGSDSSLEFEKEDTFKYYKDFFYDVILELEKCGKIRRFVTCCNHEPHLRGNVYIQYETTREALSSYHKFNGRFYAGKQLNVEFCSISNWRNAICGLFFRNKCPKGNSCNFLHIFRNPRGLYMHAEEFHESTRRKRHRKFDDSPDSSRHSHKDVWRWSESPERPINLENRIGKSLQRTDRSAREEKRKPRKRNRSRSSDERTHKSRRSKI
ncbi:hypothetical protein D910_03702 [Dendroctonus ponderosae]|uniref:C3H1-type domain-containing protein n=1 Tax=Dendroctonus ponderosae TaxID=77166 RepID=U4TXG1_DENPD|nr:hypothetical protein D910_03702 [Dendroctonus ponderosae]